MAYNTLSDSTLKAIKYTDLKVGDIVHFYNARFEITKTEICQPNEHNIVQAPFMRAVGKWIDGAIVTGYFGPDIDWTFQGNERAQCSIEI